LVFPTSVTDFADPEIKRTWFGSDEFVGKRPEVALSGIPLRSIRAGIVEDGSSDGGS
jgi:hypothetical protein